MPGGGPPLDPPPAMLAGWLDEACAYLVDHLSRLGDLPARGLVGDEATAITAAVGRPIADAPDPGGLVSLLGRLEQATRVSYTAPGPGYLAYIPGGGLPASAVADLLASGLNRYTGVSPAAPALLELEADVLRWLCSIVGYGSGAWGLLTSGGSLATFCGVVTAREARLGDDHDLRDARIYVTAQAHHSVGKAVRLAGFGRQTLCAVGVDEDLRMDPQALAARIDADRAAGRVPCLVVIAAGTTNTGVIDPLEAIADVCAERGVWLHVDAAYGGPFVLTERGSRRLAGIDRADSITLDPHKGLFLPYGSGCLLVREGRYLAQAHAAEADYLQDLGDAGTPSPHAYGPELSRPFRGLRLWLPLQLHGVAAFRRALDEKLDQTEWATRRLRELAAAGLPIEILRPPDLTVVVFWRRRGEGVSLEENNRANAAWLERINARDRVLLTSTMLPGPDGPQFVIRICVLSFRTDMPRMEACLLDIEQTC